MQLIDLERADVIPLSTLHSSVLSHKNRESNSRNASNQFCVANVMKSRYQEVRSKSGNKIGLLELTIVDESWLSFSNDKNMTCQLCCWGQKASDRLRYCLAAGSIIVIHKPFMQIKRNSTGNYNQVALSGNIIASTMIGEKSLKLEWIEVPNFHYTGALSVLDHVCLVLSDWIDTQPDLSLIRFVGISKFCVVII